MTKKHAVRRPV